MRNRPGFSSFVNETNQSKLHVVNASRISCCPSEHVTVEHVTYHFLDGVGDEDEGDETGEALLCEAGHVFYDVAGV